MLYYIYYGYIAGVTTYKLYKYLEIAKIAYTTCNYTYTAIKGVYKFVNYISSLEDISEWEICDLENKIQQ